MPVEECGNMLIMAASTAIAQGNTTYVRDHMETLDLLSFFEMDTFEYEEA